MTHDCALCIAYALASGDPYPCDRSDEWKRSFIQEVETTRLTLVGRSA